MYKKCMIEKSVRRVNATQLRWFAHVDQMSNECLVKVLYDKIKRTSFKQKSQLLFGKFVNRYVC